MTIEEQAPPARPETTPLPEMAIPWFETPFFEELLPRLASIELAGEPEWVQANFVGGLKSMPVRYSFEPARQAV